ncbi:MAG: thioredoxin domain-containing protein [Myxococcota bacterium]|nr:thioredoxin domain-containing protein [Myxococcota bacterium]
MAILPMGILYLSSCSLWGEKESILLTKAPTRVSSLHTQKLPVTSVLARVGDRNITMGDLPRTLDGELRELQNRWAQKELFTLWLHLEKRIEEALLDKEAEAQGIHAGRLINREIKALLKVPTEAELVEFYEKNKDMIPVEYEEAKPLLKREILLERERLAKISFFQELREKYKVDIALPIPDFPRYEMKFPGRPSTGPADAPVTIVEFLDFQCPYCRQAHLIARELRERYPSEVRIVFRFFPLPNHPQALLAARASYCADLQGLFWPFHDRLFENSGELRQDTVKKIALELSLESGLFNKCLSDAASLEAVKDDIRAGKRLGVEGTPSIFINGIKLVGLLPFPLITELIDAELAE